MQCNACHCQSSKPGRPAQRIRSITSRNHILSEIYLIFTFFFVNLTKMRRNNRGGRGAPAWQMQHSQRVSGGPLMSDHFGLQDIDKELELLKRKREIIEQQQQILSNEFQRNDYQQPYSNNSRFDDYAKLYDDYGQSSRKRPIAVWEDDIPSKRFSGPTNRSFDSPRPQRGGPSRYRGGYEPRSLRPARSGPVKRDFNPSRVTKTPAASHATTPARKQVVTPAKQAEGHEWNRLRPDREPSLQLNGRLELALGHIIKEIRLNHNRDELNSSSVIKIIKRNVRERIRELMMGELIDKVEAVTAKYRERYSKESDLDLVTNAIDDYNGKEVSVMKIDDPEAYFKKNMFRITEMKLKNMFQKLEEVYREERRETKPDASFESKALAKNPLDPKITSQEKYQNLDRFLTAKLTLILKKYVPYLMKIMDLDQKYNKLKNTITSETVRKLSGADNNTAEDSSDVSMTSVDQSNTTEQQSPRNPYGPLAYYAKIMGKPGLPKRKLMKTFFEKFKPLSVKKHRTMHNLLFAGFDDKESYDKLLTADGQIIGKHKLSIRVSERAIPEQKKTDLNASTSSEDKIIGPDLDAQITDLLSSIRQGEEDEDEKQEPENGENANGNVEDDKNTDANTEGADANAQGVENADENAEVVENAKEVENADVYENTDTAETENVEAPETENAETDETKNVEAPETDTAETENVEAPETENADATEVVDTNETETLLPDAGEKAGTNDAEQNDYPDDGIPWTSDVQETPENGKEEEEKADQVKALASEAKTAGKTTRASTRLAATPGRIQTRRASRLAQNDN